MSYFDKNLVSGEEILFRTKKHLIIFFYPLVLTIISVFAFQYMSANMILYRIAWAPAFITLIFWGSTGLDYLMSEFVVTNKRIMMREGFFFRHANELRINTISQVNIDQSIVGHFFNYGTVSINSFGTFDAYTVLDNPEVFRKCVNEQLNNVNH